MGVTLLWPPRSFVVLESGSFDLSAYGIYELGKHIQALYFALAVYTNARILAPYFDPLRSYTKAQSFEEIGQEATALGDALLNMPKENLTASERDTLRSSAIRWQTLIGERLATRYVIHPATVIDPALLLRGIDGLLAEQARDMLTEIEKSDLDEAIGALVIQSSTASEHMSLRAVESLMRRWYRESGGPQKQWKGWDTPLKWLEEHKGVEHSQIVARLKFLKLRRDAIAHPDYISNMGSAQITLLEVCGLSLDIGLAMQSETGNSEP
jgi:hypothetical protein